MIKRKVYKLWSSHDMKYRFIIGFCLIVGLALFLRLYQLGANPAGFFCDEASIGYNAYSILTTGKDEYGKSFPLFFQAFGEYKNPLDIYSTLPLVAAFGLNEFSVRLESVFFSILTVIAFYYVGRQIKITIPVYSVCCCMR